MSDGPALLAAIRAAPHDDTPRVVYADWLDENGEPDRAEFVRVQVGLAKWPNLPRERPYFRATQSDAVKREVEDALESGAGRLRRRERQFFDSGDIRTFCGSPLNSWGHDFAKANPGYGGRRVVWSRGFVAELVLPAADWLAHGDAITAAHPVTRVVLTTVPEFEQIEVSVNGYRMKLNGLSSVVHFRWGMPTRDAAGRILAAEWPGVEFELPRGSAYLTANDIERDMAAVQEAGRRAAMGRNRRVMSAILGPPENPE